MGDGILLFFDVFEATTKAIINGKNGTIFPTDGATLREKWVYNIRMRPRGGEPLRIGVHVLVRARQTGPIQ